MVRITSQGWQYEADQRHAEILTRELNLSGANGVKSPGVDPRPWELEVRKQRFTELSRLGRTILRRTGRTFSSRRRRLVGACRRPLWAACANFAASPGT